MCVQFSFVSECAIVCSSTCRVVKLKEKKNKSGNRKRNKNEEGGGIAEEIVGGASCSSNGPKV